eukprot:7387282-Prymnesium_polylepis.2
MMRGVPEKHGGSSAVTYMSAVPMRIAVPRVTLFPRHLIIMGAVIVATSWPAAKAPWKAPIQP